MSRSAECTCDPRFTCGHCLRNAKPYHYTLSDGSAITPPPANQGDAMFHTPVHKITNYPRNERQAYVEIRKPDFAVSDQGTVVLFVPQNEAAKAFLENTFLWADYQSLGRGKAVDHRYAQQVYDVIVTDGFTVTV